VASVISRCPDPVTLGIDFADGQLRVEARVPAGNVSYDGEPDLGLAVVAILTRDWGTCQSAAGTTTYFTLR
jgi:hypothetical protein